jgi:hypothetical protein
VSDRAPKSGRVISPPGRQRAAGAIVAGSVLWNVFLLQSAPTFVVVIGIIAAPLVVSVGALLAVPTVAVRDGALTIRDAWGRRRRVELDTLAEATIVPVRAPWRFVIVMGWPVPAHFPTVACVLTSADGQVTRADALQSIRIPLFGYLLTATPDEVRGRLELLREQG